MLSKILIDVDRDGGSIIRIYGSDLEQDPGDVRDKLVSRFLGTVSRRWGLIHIKRDSETYTLVPSSLERILRSVLIRLTDPESKRLLSELIAHEFGAVNENFAESEE